MKQKESGKTHCRGADVLEWLLSGDSHLQLQGERPRTWTLLTGLVQSNKEAIGFLVDFAPDRVKTVDLESPLIMTLLFLQVT